MGGMGKEVNSVGNEVLWGLTSSYELFQFVFLGTSGCWWLYFFCLIFQVLAVRLTSHGMESNVSVFILLVSIPFTLWCGYIIVGQQFCISLGARLTTHCTIPYMRDAVLYSRYIGRTLVGRVGFPGISMGFCLCCVPHLLTPMATEDLEGRVTRHEVYLLVQRRLLSWGRCGQWLGFGCFWLGWVSLPVGYGAYLLLRHSVYSVGVGTRGLISLHISSKGYPAWPCNPNLEKLRPPYKPTTVNLRWVPATRRRRRN